MPLILCTIGNVWLLVYSMQARDSFLLYYHGGEQESHATHNDSFLFFYQQTRSIGMFFPFDLTA